MKKLKFLKYVGNKFKYLDLIKAELDKCDKNNLFVEPFLGSGTVLVNLGYEFKKCYGFDINKPIIKLLNDFATISFKDIQKFYDNEVCRYGDISKSKEAYYSFRNDVYNKKYFNTGTKEESIGLFYLMRSCINSMIRFGPNGFNQSYGNRCGDIYLTETMLLDLQHSLNKAKIIYLDFFDIPNQIISSPGTTWFIDPPYFERNVVGYKQSFSEEKTIKFLNVVKNIKGRVLYTNTGHKLNDEILDGWRKINIRNMRSISPNRSAESNNKVEVMYCNF